MDHGRKKKSIDHRRWTIAKNKRTIDHGRWTIVKKKAP